MSGNTSTETVRDAMTPKPTVVRKEATAMEAARTLATDNVGSLPVVQGDGQCWRHGRQHSQHSP